MSNIDLGAAEMMALAVMKGDLKTARMLADYLLSDLEGVPSTADRRLAIVREGIERKVINIENVRVILYASDPDMEFRDHEELDNFIRNWLRNGTTLALTGIEKVELYEFTKGEV